MLEIKKALLNTGLIEDNQYLDEYIDLVLNNLNTKKVKGATQEHHIIPIFCYVTSDFQVQTGGYHTAIANKRRRDLTKIANSDPLNRRVHLKFSDHMRAHSLLIKCGKSYNFIISNANSCMLMMNLVRKALNNGIVTNLDSDENIQKAYVYIMEIKRKPKDDPKLYKQVTKGLNRGGVIKTRRVKCLETGVIYDSIKEAEESNNIPKSKLNQILIGRRKQIPGMTFEYVGEAVVTCG